MAITVKHKFVSAIPDAGDTTIVQPSNWNDDHQLTGTIPVANGGTGASTLTGYVYGNGTSAMTANTTVPSTDITGLGTMSTQNANAVAVTGGTINGTTIGATTASTGLFTYISTSSSTSTTPVLSFNGSNSPYAAGATISGSYLQHILQNKSGTAGASTNYVLSNDLGTDSTYYGEFGMNSSIYTSGTPADFFSINNGIYFSGHDGDLSIGSGNGYKTYIAWGTVGDKAHVINASGAIGLNTNLGTTPALSGTTNFGTSGQVLTSGGSAATPTWTTPATGTVTSVTATSPVTSTGGTTPVIAMPAATTSVNGYLTSTDWTTFNGKYSVGGALGTPSSATLTNATGLPIGGISATGTPSIANFLRGDGTWSTPAGAGTVTSVALTAPSIFTVTGSPITSTGTLALTYSGTALPILNGGTGATTASAAFNALSPLTTVGDTLYGGTSGAGTRLAIGTAGQVLTVNAGATALQWSTVTGTGTVTTVSVVSANGFAGTVANASTTPAITLTTSITGVLKGNATAISAATAGTDYSAGTSALTTGILKSTTTTGALTIAVAADFPTLNQNTTGSAATLTTARAIYGNNFDGSAALTQVITGTYGGTGVNNGTNTITIAGNLTHAGAFTQSYTATANTAVTLPAGATASANNLLSSATAVGIVTGTPSSTTYLRGDGTWAAAGGSMTYPSGTGIAVVTSGTSWGTTLTAPSGTIVGTTDTQTLTNKTITSRVSSTTSITSPLADNSDNFDMYAATAQAGALTISADAGTPTDGRKIQFRFTCDATPRVITFTGGASKAFKPVGVTLTVSGSNFTYTLTASKTTYVGAIYNASSARWEIVALSQEV